MATQTSTLRMLGRATRRPRLVGALLRAAWRFRARDWWRRPPFLPLPPREYLDWRWHTAYGHTGRDASLEDLEAYLRWANRMHRTRLGSGAA